MEVGCETAKHRDALSQLEDIQFYDGYAEPGYDDPECGIIATGNWNDVSIYDRETGKFVKVDNTVVRVGRLLERLGVSLEWSDEWTTCCQCNKLVRTSPTSYGWQPSYISICGDSTCEDCTQCIPALYIPGSGYIIPGCCYKEA